MNVSSLNKEHFGGLGMNYQSALVSPDPFLVVATQEVFGKVSKKIMLSFRCVHFYFIIFNVAGQKQVAVIFSKRNTKLLLKGRAYSG